MLVTQNIDNYHVDVISEAQGREEGTPNFAFTDSVYEIHGNVLYMHCINKSGSCSIAFNFYKCPSTLTDDLVPKCRECGANMKPHAMFFDESYSEGLYRTDTVHKFMEEQMDALIVVGTALQTSYAKLIVNRAVQKIEVPIIEVNIESAIKKGFRVLVNEPSEKSLPILFSEL
jgi:NAD-dependent SIR2 family protein deacetylase